MSISELLSPLVGRLVFGWFFLVQVAIYGSDWEGTIALMNFRGISGAAFLLAVTLLLIVMGSLSLIFGYLARYGALILFIVTVVATVAMHDYWRITGNPAARAADFQVFACQAAIAGGLLMLVGLGSGPMSADNRRAGGNRKR
jgi:putative oxidoreductase